MNKRLEAPPGYGELTPEQKSDICNGCGPKGWGWVVPDRFHIIGVDFTEACNIHDYSYQVGMPKDEADRMFLRNMQQAAESAYFGFKLIARRRALIYYLFVKVGGAGSYNRAKGDNQ